MSIEQRLKAIEKGMNIAARYNYMLVIATGWAAAWDKSEETAKGYKIQPCIPSFGGTGGAPFYLATDEDLKAFIARPDVAMLINIIGVTDEAERARWDAWYERITEGGTLGRAW